MRYQLWCGEAAPCVPNVGEAAPRLPNDGEAAPRVPNNGGRPLSVCLLVPLSLSWTHLCCTLLHQQMADLPMATRRKVGNVNTIVGEVKVTSIALVKPQDGPEWYQGLFYTASLFLLALVLVVFAPDNMGNQACMTNSLQHTPLYTVEGSNVVIFFKATFSPPQCLSAR